MKELEYLLDHGGFLGATKEYGKTRAVIFGVPMDFTVSFRPGARMGPRKIREVSYGLEDYSIYAGGSLKDVHFFDAGDVDIPFGNVERSLDIIERVTAKLLDDGKIPVVLGGEHLISYPVIKQVARRCPDLVVVHFDAHADLRDTFFGESLSHATVMRRVYEHVGEKRLYQFGIRSGIKDEFDFAKKHTNMYPVEVVEPFKSVYDDLKGKPVYVTLDIDVVDPAFAPGTGTPEPGGCTSREILEVISLLRELKVVGFDLVEVSPPADLSERTSLLAAKILREVLIALG
jgi:agmatinase